MLKRSSTGVVIVLTVLILLISSSIVLAIQSISRTPDSLTINVGETKSFTVKVTPSNTVTGSFSASIGKRDGAGNPTKILITVYYDSKFASGHGPRGVTVTDVSWSAGVEKEIIVNVKNEGTVGEFWIKFEAADGTYKWDEATIYATFSAIPEPQTTLTFLIGLMVLGMAVMRSRKE
jgi:hypothetical protein